MSEPSNFEQKLAQVVETYQQNIIDILRGASVSDLVEVAKKGAVGPAVVEEAAAQAEAEEDDQEQVQGDVADEVAAEPESTARPKATTKTKSTEKKKTPKKRNWPTCSAPGCTRNMYGPSGKAKLCYQHHREAGGQAAPFAKKKSGAKTTATTDKAATTGAPAPASPHQPAMHLERQPPKPEASPPSARPKTSRRRKQAEVSPSVVVRKKNGDKDNAAVEPPEKPQTGNGKDG